MSRIALAQALFEESSTLLIIPPAQYNDVIATVPKRLQGKSVCYVTLNKTYNALVEVFEREQVDLSSFVFIDAITKSIGKVENKETCYFVSSPQALTELSIVMAEFLEYAFDYVIVDSLTTLLIYQKSEEPVLKFLSNMLNKIKKSGAKSIFYVVNVDDHKQLIQQASMILDEVVDLESTELSDSIEYHS